MRQAIRSVVTAAVISIAAVALIGGIVAFRISPNLSGSEPEKITQDAVSGPTPSASTTPEAITVTEPQMKLLKLATVELRTFQDERIAFGEIAPNEDLMTPIFAPYTGRIARLQAKPGDHVAKGDPLFEIDSVDLVQAEGTMISAAGTLQKTRSQLDLTTRALARQRALLRANAAAQKDVEQAEADQRGAESDVRAAIGSLAAAQDAVRIFGKTDAQTTRILETRRIDPLMPVYSPIAGSVIARKAGPGQLVQPSNSDPVYVIADLTTVWLVASVPSWISLPSISGTTSRSASPPIRSKSSVPASPTSAA
ncbi:MAG: efflux RND transporter periplasmic adaptor subunit [Pseudomonadota bacterium]